MVSEGMPSRCALTLWRAAYHRPTQTDHDRARCYSRHFDLAMCGLSLCMRAARNCRYRYTDCAYVGGVRRCGGVAEGKMGVEDLFLGGLDNRDVRI